MRRINLMSFGFVLLAQAAVASDTHQDYKGYETRDIASLSEADIAALNEGSGWGLALPAELNGYPGPTHVLELADSLGLSSDQIEQTQDIFAQMREDAIAKGSLLIAAERKLDQGFKSAQLDPADLKGLIDEAAAARADLRYVHLLRHLMMIDLLDAGQVERYVALRGYTSDPCLSVPEGHNAEMWRRHNGCSD